MSESCPKLLDLMMSKKEGKMRHGCSCNDEKKLELRLGLPCEDDWSNNNNSLRYYNNNINGGGGGGVIGCGQDHRNHPWTLQQRNTTGATTSSTFAHQSAEKKAFSTTVNNISQKRAAPTPVVGWPPIRSFRKNLANPSSAKSVPEQQNAIPSKDVNEKPDTENSRKGLFVKINMDGVPIGRKVDLNACNCYENLSSTVDKLFRGLLAAQRDSSADGIDNKQEEQKPITGLLDGSGEYTLVYEDNEGDRMLVGDVPWPMFVSTVKRLRVLKSSDLATLSRGGSKQGKVMVKGASK